jgi:hypothetical protein
MVIDATCSYITIISTRPKSRSSIIVLSTVQFRRLPRQPDWTVRVHALPTMFFISQIDVTYIAAQSTS